MFFQTAELQILDDIGTEPVKGAFTLPTVKKAFGCYVRNEGFDGVYLAFGNDDVTVTNRVGKAEGTATFYLAPGEARYLDKGPYAHFAACTDDGISKLYLEAGKDS